MRNGLRFRTPGLYRRQLRLFVRCLPAPIPMCHQTKSVTIIRPRPGQLRSRSTRFTAVCCASHLGGTLRSRLDCTSRLLSTGWLVQSTTKPTKRPSPAKFPHFHRTRSIQFHAQREMLGREFGACRPFPVLWHSRDRHFDHHGVCFLVRLKLPCRVSGDRP